MTPRTSLALFLFGVVTVNLALTSLVNRSAECSNSSSWFVEVGGDVAVERPEDLRGRQSITLRNPDVNYASKVYLREGELFGSLPPPPKSAGKREDQAAKPQP